MRESCEFQLIGGLGNQLFILAAAISHSNSGYQTTINTGNLDSYGSHHGNSIENLVFDIEVPNFVNSGTKLLGNRFRLTSALTRRLKLRRYGGWISEIETGFVDLTHKKRGKTYHLGYYQSWIYSQQVGGLSTDCFSPRSPSESYLELKESAAREKPVIIHIRRGDYMSMLDQFGVLDLKYYEIAISEVVRTLPELQNFWIVSNDSIFAESVASLINGNVKFIDPTLGISDLETLFLMSHGAAHILANSSYSWWGAFLARNSRLIIAPNKWFKNGSSPNLLIPNHWKQISSIWI
jgi:hypothetical protein